MGFSCMFWFCPTQRPLGISKKVLDMRAVGDYCLLMAIEMMKVSDILKNVTSSSDFKSIIHFEGDTLDEMRTEFWKHVIEYKSGDSGFIRLVESILENGWAEGSAIGWQGGYLCEGHHRLVAAILLCMDEVPVSAYGKNQTINGEFISAHHNGWQEDKVPLATF